MTAATYLDSNVISYLTARPSRDVVSLAHQQVTRDWWDRQRHRFNLHVSELVLSRSGAAIRLLPERGWSLSAVYLSFASLPKRGLSRIAFFRATMLPDKAASDALHIALSAVNGMDFLLTWNCTHIANGVVLKTVNAICRDAGYEPPIVCTPEELYAP